MSQQSNEFITIKQAYSRNKHGLCEHIIRRRIALLSNKEKEAFTKRVMLDGRTHILVHPDLTTEWKRIRSASDSINGKTIPKDQELKLLVSVSAEKYSDLESIGQTLPTHKPMFYSIVKGKTFNTLHIATSETFEMVKNHIETFPIQTQISRRSISKVTLPYYSALKQGSVTIRNIDPKLFKIKYL